MTHHPVIIVHGPGEEFVRICATADLAVATAVDALCEKFCENSASPEDRNLIAAEFTAVLHEHGSWRAGSFAVIITTPVEVAELKPAGLWHAEKLLAEFCTIMNLSGGVYTGFNDGQPDPNQWEPASNREWTDLGQLYATVCRHLNITPLLDDVEANPAVWPVMTEKKEFITHSIADPRNGPGMVVSFLSQSEITDDRVVRFYSQGWGYDILEEEPRDTIHPQVVGTVIDLDVWEASCKNSEPAAE